jgi:hypothetical protein
MSLSLTLDVAISMIFVFTLAAVLASAVNELVAGAFKLRGVYLTKGIEAITCLGKNNQFKWGGLVSWLYAHFWQSKPLASPNPVDQAAAAAVAAGEVALAAAGNALAVATAIKNAANFLLLGDSLRVAIDAAAVAPAATGENVMKVVRPISGVAALQSHALLVGTPTSLPSYVPARDFATALLGVLSAGSGAAAFTQVEATIKTLPDGDLKTTLLAFIDAAAGDIDALRTRIENWFDDAMARVSGIYTRFSQYVMLVLGLVIAVGMNIDAVHLAKTLWDQPALSKAISDGATQFVTTDKNSFVPCNNSPATGGQTAVPAGKNNAAGTNACQTLDVKTVQNIIDQQKLPIGWNGANPFACLTRNKNCADGRHWNMWNAAGWLVTALAISMGAQFWFGLLTQLTNLRAAGNKPQRSDAKPA